MANTMAALQKPAWAIDESYYMDAAVSTEGAPAPPKKTIYISAGFHAEFASPFTYTADAPPEAYYVVNNISARYDAETDTVWVCNECIKTEPGVRFCKRLWMTLEAYLQSPLPGEGYMEPMDMWVNASGGNKCYQDNSLNKAKIIALWKEQGF
jgi:hypothetical protein